MHPPEKLQLVGGPWWSPDGTRLAVEAENRPAGHHQAYAAVWLVDAESGTWKLLETPSALRATSRAISRTHPSTHGVHLTWEE